jgi:RNA processing factor Prp31
VVSKGVRIEQLNTRMQLMRTKLQELQHKLQIMEDYALITTSPYHSETKERLKKELNVTNALVIELHEMLGQIERIINRLELESD